LPSMSIGGACVSISRTQDVAGEMRD